RRRIARTRRSISGIDGNAILSWRQPLLSRDQIFSLDDLGTIPRRLSLEWREDHEPIGYRLSLVLDVADDFLAVARVRPTAHHAEGDHTQKYYADEASLDHAELPERRAGLAWTPKGGSADIGGRRSRADDAMRPINTGESRVFDCQSLPIGGTFRSESS